MDIPRTRRASGPARMLMTLQHTFVPCANGNLRKCPSFGQQPYLLISFWLLRRSALLRLCRGGCICRHCGPCAGTELRRATPTRVRRSVLPRPRFARHRRGPAPRKDPPARPRAAAISLSCSIPLPLPCGGGVKDVLPPQLAERKLLEPHGEVLLLQTGQRRRSVLPCCEYDVLHAELV